MKHKLLLSLNFILLWMIGGLFEYPFIQMFFFNRSDFFLNHLPLSFILHFLNLFVLVWAFPKGPAWFHRERFWGAPVNIFIVFLPLFGWLLLIALYLFYIFGYIKTDFLIDEVEIKWEHFPELHRRMVLDRAHILNEMDVQNLAEILAGEDKSLKRSAMEKLAQTKTPDALAVLLQYRRDADADLGFYATSNLTKIKREFEEELETLKLSIKKDPTQINLRVKLAQSYLAYQASGMLELEMQHEFIAMAIYQLEQVLLQDAKHVDARLILHQIYFNRQEYQKCLELLATADASLSMLQTRAELYFAMHRFSDLQKCLREIGRLMVTPDQAWQSTLQWWLA